MLSKEIEVGDCDSEAKSASKLAGKSATEVAHSQTSTSSTQGKIGKERGDFPVITGTIDLCQMTQGNQIALLVVDLASTKTTLGVVEPWRGFER